MLINPKELQISGPDHTLSSLRSIPDCDAAITYLVRTVTDIESRLSDEGGDPVWRRLATKALSLKRYALQHIYVMRKELRQDAQHEWNRQFIALVKDRHPALFYEIGNTLGMPTRKAA